MAGWKTRVRVDAAADDIKSGMHPNLVMAKHNLSPSQFRDMYDELVQSGFLPPPGAERSSHPQEADQKTIWCPNCHTPQLEDIEECPQCGILKSPWHGAEERRGLDGPAYGRQTRSILGIGLAIAVAIALVATIVYIRKARRDLAFLQACHDGRVEAVQELITRGTDINVRDSEGMTGLMFAAASDRVEVVKLLLAHGVDVNGANRHGWTPLIKASSLGRTEVVRLLVDAGANVNAHAALNWTALIAASHDGHAEVVKILLEKGADINARSTLGWTPLMAARRNWHEPVMVLLEEHSKKLEANK
jgi:hypothetical protein